MRIDEVTMRSPRKVYLYHGTIKDNLGSIMSRGLEPRTGAFVTALHGKDIPPATYAANRQGLYRVVAALAYQIGQLYDGSGITNEEFWENAAVVVLERTTDWRRHDDPAAPRAVEHGDYWTQAVVRPIKVLVDRELENLIGIEPSEICDFVYETEYDRDRGIK
jgi:hypothetical protein